MVRPVGKSHAFCPAPWAYFLVFLVSNILLSYFPLSPGAKLGVGFLGILFPFLLALRFLPAPEPAVLFQKEFLPPLPAWVWVLLGACAVFVRFYKLTALSVWPFYDDGLWGWLAVRFNQQGLGLFPEGANFPAGYAWGLAFLFRWLKPSLFCLWFYPALLSALTVAAAAWCSQMFFSRSLSLLTTWLAAFSFWPLYVGRVGDQMVLVLLAEFLTFGLLGFYLKSPSSSSRNWRALALGAAAGTGFYVFISWATVAFLSGAAVLVDCLRRKPRSWTPLAIWAAGGVLLLAPLWRAGLGDAVRSYGSQVGFWSQRGDMGRQWDVSLSYLSAIFGGLDPSFHTYQPVWGGFLDPLLDSFLLLGFLELLKSGRWAGWGWLAAALLFLLPGMATSTREPLRVLPVLPVLLFACGLGWRRLLAGLTPLRLVFMLWGLGLAFAGLDFYHLAVKYQGIWDSPASWIGYGKSMERYRAHALLQKMDSEQGPGLIFDGFVPGLCDQSLFVLEYPINAAQNPSLSLEKASWAAVLANVNYKPFLQKRFPQARAFALSGGLNRPDGGWMLWVAPVTPATRPDFEKWRAASHAYEGCPYKDPWVLLPLLQKAEPAFEGDPFLQSCYWEKLSDLSFRVSGFKDSVDSLKYLKTAIQKGYPAANLFWRLGSFYAQTGDGEDARWAFGKALHAPMDLTDAPRDLASLETAAGRNRP